MFADIEHCEAVRAEHDFQSVWSLPNTAFDMPHPFTNAKVVKYEQHWGDTGLVTAPIKGPTWLDLWVAANECIRTSGDGHHIYIEAFDPKGDAVELQTGS